MNERAQRVQRRLEYPLLVAALLTIPALVIEESSLSDTWNTVASVLDWTIWLAFLGELVAMLAVVDSRSAWLREHPLEVVIVVLTPPFVPAGLQAARVFRLLRILRLARVAVMTRRLLSTEAFAMQRCSPRFRRLRAALRSRQSRRPMPTATSSPHGMVFGGRSPR